MMDNPPGAAWFRKKVTVPFAGLTDQGLVQLGAAKEFNALDLNGSKSRKQQSKA